MATKSKTREKIALKRKQNNGVSFVNGKETGKSHVGALLPPAAATRHGKEPIQAKLKVGAVDDEQERHADIVAKKVVSTPTVQRELTDRPCVSCGVSIQPKRRGERECPSCEAKGKTGASAAMAGETARNIQAYNQMALQRSAGSGAAKTNSAHGEATASPGLEKSIDSMRGSGGRPMEKSHRDFFESRMGHDFSDVRVHTGPEANSTSKDLGAKAYTVGRDIAFGEGQFQPETTAGKELIAHELTHTVQQGAVRRKSIQAKAADPGVAKRRKSNVSVSLPSERKVEGDVKEGGAGGEGRGTVQRKEAVGRRRLSTSVIFPGSVNGRENLRNSSEIIQRQAESQHWHDIERVNRKIIKIINVELKSGSSPNRIIATLKETGLPDFPAGIPVSGRMALQIRIVHATYNMSARQRGRFQTVSIKNGIVYFLDKRGNAITFFPVLNPGMNQATPEDLAGLPGLIKAVLKKIGVGGVKVILSIGFFGWLKKKLGRQAVSATGKKLVEMATRDVVIRGSKSIFNPSGGFSNCTQTVTRYFLQKFGKKNIEKLDFIIGPVGVKEGYVNLKQIEPFLKGNGIYTTLDSTLSRISHTELLKRIAQGTAKGKGDAIIFRYSATSQTAPGHVFAFDKELGHFIDPQNFRGGAAYMPSENEAFQFLVYWVKKVDI